VTASGLDIDLPSQPWLPTKTMVDHRVNRNFTLFNFLSSWAALTIFHALNTSQSAKKATESKINLVQLQVKLLVKLCINENSLGLAAEAYWSLTIDSVGLYFVKNNGTCLS